MSKFVLEVSEKMVKEWCTTMIINDMDIYLLMDHDAQIEEEKLKGK